MHKLAISGNDALTDIDGLSSLTEVGSSLVISGNDVLTSIVGLSSVTSSFLDYVHINGNDALVSLEGLSGITTVGLLYLDYNDVLCQSLVSAFVESITVEGAVQAYPNNNFC